MSEGSIIVALRTELAEVRASLKAANEAYYIERSRRAQLEQTAVGLTREQQHEWALAVAEWSEERIKELTTLNRQAREICERVMPEKYRQDV